LQKPNKSLLNSTIEDVGLLYAEADYDEVVWLVKDYMKTFDMTQIP
jgi:hypothetical protein